MHCACLHVPRNRDISGARRSVSSGQISAEGRGRDQAMFLRGFRSQEITGLAGKWPRGPRGESLEPRLKPSPADEAFRCLEVRLLIGRCFPFRLSFPLSPSPSLSPPPTISTLRQDGYAHGRSSLGGGTWYSDLPRHRGYVSPSSSSISAYTDTGWFLRTDVAGVEFVKSSSGVLVPQPSNNANDPLNWSPFWKAGSITSVSLPSS